MPTTTKTRLFWTLHVLGWLIFTIVNGGVNGYFSGSKSVVLINSLVGLWGFLITLGYRRYIYKAGWKDYSLSQLVWPALLGTLIVSAIWMAISALVAYYGIYFLEGQRVPLWILFINGTVSGLLIIAVWTALYFSYHFFRRYTQAEIEKWKLEATLKEAQLAGLRTQINPHFMFNALNNIRALILEDGHKARLMLTHLSDLLRYSLAETQHEKVSLRTDLETINYFMALHSIQFEDKLKFKSEIGEGLQEFKVPPMLIQLMIENAIKHGIAQQAEGGTIQLIIQKEQEHLSISVKNTGTLGKRVVNSMQSAGVGIKNIKDRLALLYNGQAYFSLTEKGEMVEAKVRLPLST
ncbi:MAG: histidine kinase [Saprospiraceae bacterium]|nr:histidine kinase [Saprospiraceae bacterium]